MTLIGPGRLILVVGPSGAGKDTLLDYARSMSEGDPDLVFPRRVVTRQANKSEDHESISEDAFGRALMDGAFSAWWEAHGLKYGLPISLESDIRAGRAVFCNVSRTIVSQMRERFRNVTVVLVTAPEEILRTRLQGRARTTDGDLDQRIRRTTIPETTLRPDVVLQNIDSVENAGNELIRIALRREMSD